MSICASSLLELTRAANYVCDHIRHTIDGSFRLSEGRLVASSGPYVNFEFKTLRVEYRNEERTSRPYRGLEWFKTARKDRDYNFGEGQSVDDPACRIAGD